jgi:hypothetical protein
MRTATLTPTQLAVLRIFAEHGPLSREAARALAVSRGMRSQVFGNAYSRLFWMLKGHSDARKINRVGRTVLDAADRESLLPKEEATPCK